VRTSDPVPDRRVGVARLGQNDLMASEESGLPDAPYLVAYDYGGGGLWAILMAPSSVAIAGKYPELTIADDRPTWMSADRYEELLAQPQWLDDPPSGILEAVVADRQS
jgi:hypothetical protein